MKAMSPSDTTQTTKELLLHLAEHGCKARIVSVQHVRDMQEEIEGHFKQGLLDKEFYMNALRISISKSPMIYGKPSR
jgi:hypothetical protein